MNVIVYQELNNPVSVLLPADCGLSLQQIGEKDVPNGVKFWIVDSSFLPTDRTLRNAWELDTTTLGAESGIGGKIV